MQKIIDYIKQQYDPTTIIIYGSYADGSNNAHSDFDALIISNNQIKIHDTSFIDNVQLDVFVYPSSYFTENIEYNQFLQIFDGVVIMDVDGYGRLLKNKVTDYVYNIAQKTYEEIYDEIKWCEKMLLRTRRNDAEGMFRWHWLLTESLQIYCDLKHHAYLGPKKSLLWMEKEHPDAFECYRNAIFEFNFISTQKWINYLIDVLMNYR